MFDFWPNRFYIIFEGFLEKVFVSIEKLILPLYDMHIIVLIDSEIRENCRKLYLIILCLTFFARLSQNLRSSTIQ